MTLKKEFLQTVTPTSELSRTKKKQPWRSEMMRRKWVDPEERQAMINARMGHFVSLATREKIGKASRGRKHTEAYRREMSQERGAVRIRAYPLLLRGGIAGEVARITGLKKTQVQNLRGDLRKRGELKKHNKEEESQAKRKAHRLEKMPSISEACDLAEELLRVGFFTGDVTKWDRLQEIYDEYGKKYGVELPEDFAYKLTLEAFLKVKECIGGEGGDLLGQYINAGESVGSDWFYSEEVNRHRRFITAVTSNGSKTKPNVSHRGDAIIFQRG